MNSMSQGNIKVEMHTITPAVAAVMLGNNPANRPLRKFHVEALARDMKSGRWQVNGDVIRMNCDGSLIDGQHRLSACVLSDVPFQTLVISGLPSDVRATIDGGAKRTHGDRLGMVGVANANQISSTLRMIGQIANNQAVGRFTGSELDVIFAAHPGVSDSAKLTAHAFPMMGTILCSLHYIGTYLGQGDAADRFVQVFKTGIPSYPGDAAHALRERMIKHRDMLTRYSNLETLRASIAVWRHFTSNTPVKIIKPTDFAIPGWTPDQLGLKS